MIEFPFRKILGVAVLAGVTTYGLLQGLAKAYEEFVGPLVPPDAFRTQDPPRFSPRLATERTPVPRSDYVR